ncbi:hypothetical protein GCM10011321_33160 [Youhaiella tibetensis]|uniref:Uncharacterized protein n=1 Tax=Paradevosia tibetensis TaxID=1447062 RepID=A0A5B9DHF9_9HYPH|nr:DegT/DnrJ/EryC1/StrS family aminotransferase [Youhaiella tibetensis]QEE18740.1 hypothetical protein FNA67_00430 [Youhaiella tibetensis]GGF39673.1 hypothetical protein GCM10011321_33160 [Youhaiella tibetensis]
MTLRGLATSGRRLVAAVLGERTSTATADVVWRGIFAVRSLQAKTFAACRRIQRGAWTPIRFMRPFWDKREFAVGTMSNSGSAGSRHRLDQKLRSVLEIPESHALVLTGSGRSALALGLQVLAEQNPDRKKVLLPSFGCRGIYDPIIEAGLVPFFVDVDDDLLASEDDIIGHIDNTVLACLAVNTCGKQMALDRVVETARNYGVFVIEDDCHAFGKSQSGQVVDLRILSFGMGKNAMASAGGALIASVYQNEIQRAAFMLKDEPDYASRGRFSYFAKRYWNRRHEGNTTPIDRSLVTQYDSTIRMSSRDALIMISQIDKLDYIVSTRQNNASFLRYELTPNLFQTQTPACHVYTKLSVVFSNPSLMVRFRAHLLDWGIETEEMYFPLHLRPFAAAYNQRALPRTEALKGCVLNIPIRPNLTTQELKRIKRSIRDFAENFHD